MGESLPSMCEVQGSIQEQKKKKKTKQVGERACLMKRISCTSENLSSAPQKSHKKARHRIGEMTIEEVLAG